MDEEYGPDGVRHAIARSVPEAIIRSTTPHSCSIRKATRSKRSSTMQRSIPEGSSMKMFLFGVALLGIADKVWIAIAPAGAKARRWPGS